MPSLVEVEVEVEVGVEVEVEVGVEVEVRSMLYQQDFYFCGRVGGWGWCGDMEIKANLSQS